MLVHGRQRCQIEPPSDLFVAWTVAVLVDEASYKIEDLPLPFCKRHACSTFRSIFVEQKEKIKFLFGKGLFQ